jgi:hypothetical protein
VYWRWPRWYWPSSSCCGESRYSTACEQQELAFEQENSKLKTGGTSSAAAEALPFGLTAKTSPTARTLQKARNDIRLDVGSLLSSRRLGAKRGGLPGLAISNRVSHSPKALQKRFTGSRREQRLPKIIDDESKRGSKSKQSSPMSIEFGFRSTAELWGPQDIFGAKPSCILVFIS